MGLSEGPAEPPWRPSESRWSTEEVGGELNDCVHQPVVPRGPKLGGPPVSILLGC